jgi:diphthine synthase
MLLDFEKVNTNDIQESYYGREVIVADREMVESSSDEILADAESADVAFLVVGDPFGWVLP